MSSQYTKKTLTNGLSLLTVPMPSVGSVTALLVVGVGSRYEKEKARGLTHFLEHMPFKGTKKYPTALKLSSLLDSVGAEYNAFTGKEYTGYYVKSAAKHLPLALEVLSQLVFYPLIDNKEMEREKGVIIEEINMYEDQPMAKVLWDFESLIYRKTSLGWETIGTKETVASLQRKDFIDHLNQWYQPVNMTIGIAGSFKKPEEVVNKYFDGQRKAHSLDHLKKEAVFSQNKAALKLHFKKTEQAHLCLGVRAYKRAHKDRYALSVLSTALGGNMSSRLFTEVREKRGLAYYIKSLSQGYTDNGYLVTRAGTDINKTTQALKVILNEYQKITSKKIVERKELQKAKEYLKGKLILEIEDTEAVASLYTEDWLLEKATRTPKEILKKIDEVTEDDVERVAKDIFKPANFNLAIIGPFKEKDRLKLKNLLQ